ncbi:MAG: hypothetical protein M3Y56_07735 [Armatimonadota bacterium]|nr:hypothetical protein [Armatimonadota bacterium]
MARQCQLKPELHQAVMDTIAQIYSAHTGGGGTLLLETIVQLFTPDLSAAETTLLTSRGNLQIKPVDAATGTFVNGAEAVQLKRSGVTIVVPPQVSGTYQSSQDNFRLMFDPVNTIEGRLLFFRAKLEDISADAHTLNVDLSGEAFDQCIIHAP